MTVRRFRGSLVVVLVVSGIGCDDPGTSMGGADGMRLHQVRWSYDEGGSEREREHYFDTELGGRRRLDHQGRRSSTR